MSVTPSASPGRPRCVAGPEIAVATVESHGGTPVRRPTLGGMASVQPWPGENIQGVADVLGATDTGLTGSEIGHLLRVVKAPDPTPDATKRHRLYNGLAQKQNDTGFANSTVAFIREAMAPVRSRNEPKLFSLRQQDLNEVLVHIGLRVNDKGQVARGPQAETLSEAAERAGSIRAELRCRGTHDEVLRYCTDEILAKDNFHAVLEAAKSVPDRIRSLTGLKSLMARLSSTTRSALARGRC